MLPANVFFFANLHRFLRVFRFKDLYFSEKIPSGLQISEINITGALSTCAMSG